MAINASVWVPVYARLVARGKKALADVPAEIRKEVKAAAAKL